MKGQQKIDPSALQVNDRVRFYFDDRKIGFTDCTVVDISTINTEGYCSVVLDGESAERAMDVTLLYYPELKR